MDFQDFMMELCQDYTMLTIPILMGFGFYWYAGMGQKRGTKLFGIRQSDAQIGSVGGKRADAKFPKRQAANSQLIWDDDSEDREESEDVKYRFGLPAEDGEDSEDYDIEELPGYDEEDILERYDDMEEEKQNKCTDDVEKKHQETPQTRDGLRGKVIVMYVVPRISKYFLGYELLQALSNYHVHLSEKKHFQRFENMDGSGELWFHVASLTNPGTFDMSEPGKLQCQGLVFIMESNKVSDLSTAYDVMLDTCSGLAEDINAKILDDKQQPFTERIAQEIRYAIARNTMEEACVD